MRCNAMSWNLQATGPEDPASSTQIQSPFRKILLPALQNLAQADKQKHPITASDALFAAASPAVGRLINHHRDHGRCLHQVCRDGVVVRVRSIETVNQFSHALTRSSKPSGTFIHRTLLLCLFFTGEFGGSKFTQLAFPASAVTQNQPLMVT